jgi:hypothetical protein
VRIVTWNLDHCRSDVRDRQLEVLADLNADLEVLTEPGKPSVHEARGGKVIASPARRGDRESWVLLRGVALKQWEKPIPFERMAVAARGNIDGTNVAIYGSVLPWRAGAGQAPDVFGQWAGDVPPAALYGAWLTDQVRDLSELRDQFPDHAALWAGDFNVPLIPPLEHHLPAGSQMVRSALKNIGLRAWNDRCPHREPGLHTIDLICGPEALELGSAWVDRRTLKGSGLSDHPCYVVDVHLAQATEMPSAG